MRFLFRGFLLSFVLLSLVSCKKAIKPEELPANISPGGLYYTQFVIRYEKGAHLTTNYRRGASIPVNTPVRVLNLTNKTIEVEMEDSGQKLVVKNVEKHTGDDVYRAFDKLFGRQKVNLSKFNKLERQHIESGTVAKGMRKEAVIVAIGYPPITETMNLDSNTWVYWSGRFNRFKVHFRNDVVSTVED